MPQQRFPSRTPPRPPPKTQRKKPPDLTEYVKSYKQAGKVWLDTLLEKKEQAYITLFDTRQLGDPHIENFPNADRQRVLNCVKDRTGRFLSEDDFAMYIKKEDEDTNKPQTKEALKDYYDAVHTLCELQTNLMSSTKVLEEQIKDKTVSWDIIKQVQLPAVQLEKRWKW